MDKIYNVDCREGLKLISDKEFAVCMTDFPYGIKEGYGEYKDTQDNLKELIKDVVPELIRVAKIVAITVGVGNMYLYPKPDWILNWYCPAGVGSGPWGFCTWQPILVYGKDPYLSGGKGRQPDSINYMGSSNVDWHPCAKPIGFWRRLLKRISVDPCKVIDPMTGAGTTAIVCINEGYEYLGFEIDKNYYKKSLVRIQQETSQLDLYKEKVITAKQENLF